MELVTREDALDFGCMLAITSEDEERFFDRISLEVQLAELHILSFPEDGFMEFKAEEMTNVHVMGIWTRQGMVVAKFQHGLKQGSPLCCLMANLVILMKHRVWNINETEGSAVGLEPTMHEASDGYGFTTWDKHWDGETALHVTAQGCRDDNYKFKVANFMDCIGNS